MRKQSFTLLPPWARCSDKCLVCNQMWEGRQSGGKWQPHSLSLVICLVLTASKGLRVAIAAAMSIRFAHGTGFEVWSTPSRKENQCTPFCRTRLPEDEGSTSDAAAALLNNTMSVSATKAALELS